MSDATLSPRGVKRRVAGRRRRLVGWTLIAIGVVTAMLVLLSVFGTAWVLWGGSYMRVEGGMLSVDRTGQMPMQRSKFDWIVLERDPRYEGRFAVFASQRHIGYSPRPTGWLLATGPGWAAIALTPCAVLFVVAGLVPIVSIGLQRQIASMRTPEGHCVKCRYDLRGLPAEALVCPECGTARRG
jgi:hypothetical protein